MTNLVQAPFSHWKAFKGKTVIYKLRWWGQDYVGSSRNLTTRFSWWKKLFKEKGISVVEAKVLIVCSPEQRFEYEEKAIQVFGARHNKTTSGKAGGVKGHPTSAETRRKIGLAHRGRTYGEVARRRMSESAIRRGPHSKEVYDKIAAKLLGQKRGPETGAKISAKVKGKPKSEEHKAALSAAWIKRKEKFGPSGGVRNASTKRKEQ